MIGAKTYAVLRSLVAPDQPKDKSFAELKALLKAHYDPKPLVIAERGFGFIEEIRQRKSPYLSSW